ncbi:hypothetical protein HXX01_04590 [Candidatus Nomurabacteria bacterium]|nr:hypothetical protein [Candidatus Nomurabacteria bacterium]
MRKNDQEITEIDKLFDFSNASKRNYCTLLNFSMFQVEAGMSFKVDGVIQKISYTSPLFGIRYREWRNSNWFELEDPASGNSMYWSSFQKATDWLEENRESLGFRILKEKEAIKLARICLKQGENTRKLLSVK